MASFKERLRYICGATAEQSGHPLEAHHHPIERSLAELIDWDRFKFDAQSGFWGERIKAFDWDHFNDWTQFVDDMTVNGMLLSASDRYSPLSSK
ncbi:hypothetical protein [Burkholderia glumae]|uniref:hypothetical protein n=1 Tax=Burkholderia glumae TaxID=337 RepID=UPI0021506963|nr:hypothetical protein [Burkholderia glumae]